MLTINFCTMTIIYGVMHYAFAYEIQTLTVSNVQMLDTDQFSMGFTIALKLMSFFPIEYTYPRAECPAHCGSETRNVLRP